MKNEYKAASLRRRVKHSVLHRSWNLTLQSKYKWQCNHFPFLLLPSSKLVLKNKQKKNRRHWGWGKLYFVLVKNILWRNRELEFWRLLWKLQICSAARRRIIHWAGKKHVYVEHLILKLNRSDRRKLQFLLNPLTKHC